MVVKLSSLKIDSVKENDGVWVDSYRYEGVKFKVRSDENASYRTAVDIESQRLLRKSGRGKADPVEVAEVRGRLLTDHILLGWEGLDEEYSRDTALRLLCDPAFRRLCEDIESAARFASQPDIEFVEAAVKN